MKKIIFALFTIGIFGCATKAPMQTSTSTSSSREPASIASSVCGVRSGTAGNAWLQSDDTKQSFMLAKQGGDQTLLEQLDDLIEGGSQNGNEYCVELSAGKEPRIIAAYEIKTVCGVRGGTAGNAWLQDSKGNPLLWLATQGGEQDLLEQMDIYIQGGTQNGARYCAVGKLNDIREIVQIIAAKKK